MADGSEVRRHEFALFLGARHNLDRFDGTELSGTSLLVGGDARIGIGGRIEIGASTTIRSSLDDKVTSISYGPSLGFVLVKGMLMTVGYNVEGFRDRDFGAARSTNRGVFTSIRMMIDANSFGFLGLGR